VESLAVNRANNLEEKMSLKLGQASKQAVEELLDQGFIISPTQSTYPVPHPDLTVLDSEELSRLFSQLTAWTNYVATQLAAAQIDERAAEKLLDTQTAKRMILRSSSTAKTPVAAMKADVAGSPEIIKLSEDLEVLYAYRKMIEVMFFNLERDSALISRELTRRASDFRANRQDKASW
jgi:hypothetical protein